MRSSRFGMVALAVTASLSVLVAQSPERAPRFRPGDPVLVDRDTVADASGFAEVELSEAFDLIANQFGSPGDRTARRAVNVNTIDEVPDSSWFTNRIGERPMSPAELARGANHFDPRDAREWGTWVVVGGKGPRGFQPGFRAERPGEPGRTYQLEVDPVGHPRLATGAELVGTLIYHALGYNVEDFYVIRVHPGNITISEKARIKDASGERRFTAHDLQNILRVAATDTQGRVYMSAARFGDDKDMGHFEYHGTRSDDPNDIYPHEHRRELRANRVFTAWLAHDDSRALNTRNVMVESDGRKYIRHYMHDFGAIMGSSTRFPDSRFANREYYVEKKQTWQQLLTLGLMPTRPVRGPRAPEPLPSVGWFESATFDPEKFKPNYPNAASLNLQPDDAFWAARLVSRFSDEALRAIVAQADYDDPEAVQHVATMLARRRDIVARHWLNGVNPIVDVSLGSSGALSFTNAAVAAGVASGGAYTIEWSRFDNETGTAERVAVEKQSDPRGTAPPQLLTETNHILATIWGEHPEHPAWGRPVRVYFRRDDTEWKTVGLFRDVPLVAPS